MKVVRRHMVPAEEYEIVVYRCDVPDCDFEDEDEDRVKEHFGKDHTVRARATILDDCRPMFSGKIELYWFEFEDHAQAWLEAALNGDYCKARNVQWDGPGWYYREFDEEPCARGCCKHPVADLVSIESLVRSHRDSAQGHLKRAADIERIVGTLEGPCSCSDE